MGKGDKKSTRGKIWRAVTATAARIASLPGIPPHKAQRMPGKAGRNSRNLRAKFAAARFRSGLQVTTRRATRVSTGKARCWKRGLKSSGLISILMLISCGKCRPAACRQRRCRSRYTCLSNA